MSPSIASQETKETRNLRGRENDRTRTYKKPEKRGFFGFRHGQRFARGKTFDTKGDYEKTYPEDPIFEEMAPSARIWQAYLDECQTYDAEMVEVWRDTIDVLLVFAGLFSAVVTTFVVQTLQSLQLDFNQVSASLLFELVSVQRALANGTSVDDVPSSQLTPTSSFSPSSLIVWTNGLWFVSLSLSLTIALVAVLTKQWIHHYISVPSGTPRYRSRIRHFRYMGLEKCPLFRRLGSILDNLTYWHSHLRRCYLRHRLYPLRCYQHPVRSRPSMSIQNTPLRLCIRSIQLSVSVHNPSTVRYLILSFVIIFPCHSALCVLGRFTQMVTERCRTRDAR